jgi:hypothetical protein
MLRELLQTGRGGEEAGMRMWLKYSGALLIAGAWLGSACGLVTEDGEIDPTHGTYTSLGRIVVFDGAMDTAFGGFCVSQPLSVDAVGAAPCIGLEQATGVCDCNRPGRGPAPPLAAEVARKRLAALQGCDAAGQPPCQALCFCAIEQALASESTECTQGAVPGPNGWCYVDPDVGGSAELVAACPATAFQIIRISGPDLLTTEPRRFIWACFEVDAVSGLGPSRRGGIGSPCVPSIEHQPTFSGFSLSDASIELGAAACETDVCLVNHFQGRVSCPNGQDPDLTNAAARCRLPASDDLELVQVAVEPQFADRPPASAVYCSCRCAGPGPGPFCTCPNGFVCNEVMPQTGIDEAEFFVAGSYCVKSGTDFDPINPPAEICSDTEKNCGG